jgi:beta-lactamase regulating signal transducer with metallopeptidase domain
MLLDWMAYATVMTAALLAGGLAAERLARVWSAPRRVPWAVALAVAVVFPPMLALRPVPRHVVAPVVTSSMPAPAVRLTRISAWPSATPVAESRLTLAAVVATLEPFALAAWIAASLSLLVAFTAAAVRLRLQSRSWRETFVDGTPVLVAADVGPAVVGTLRPRIVLPEWTLTLDDSKRALMLRHELEHIRAHDPILLRVATLSLVAFPWNAALWFIARRLRQSIEIDCDRRVLRSSSAAGVSRDYGMLLLLVGARRSARLTTAAGLAGYPPFLERRIKAMTSVRPSRPVLSSFALISVVALSTIAATRAPVPASLRPVTSAPIAARATSLASAPRSVIATGRPTSPVVHPVVHQVVHPFALTRPRLASPETIAVHHRDPSTISGVPFDLAPPQRSETTRVATGRVLDSASNAPLANVYVEVIGVQAPGEPNWTCSEANGDFRIKVPVGEAWLSAQSADHAFGRVILAPADSVATLRGARITEPPLPRLTTPTRIQNFSVTPLHPTSDPLIIIDGVPQPSPRDSVHLTIRTYGGQVIERDWNRRDPLPVIVIDGQELTWGATRPRYTNPCMK